MLDRLSAGSMVVVAALVLCGPAAGQARVETLVLGPEIMRNQGNVISPRGVRVATPIMKDGRSVVIVDGVEGPPLDAIFDMNLVNTNVYPELVDHRVIARALEVQNRGGPFDVIFSADGKRYAYAGQAGQEYVVIADGKELARGPLTRAGISGLRFSPLGTHVYFIVMPETADAGDGFRLVIDGRAEEPSSMQPMPVFSPDDARYAYVHTRSGTTDEHSLVIDGRRAPYVGLRPIFDAGNRLLSMRQRTDESRTALLVDGTVVIEAAVVDFVVPAPVGARYAAVVNVSRSVRDLVIDGAPVASAAQIDDVFWSPDGQHYAAICGSPEQTKYVIYDGANGPEYGAISDLRYSPDSKKLVFVGYGGGRYSVVFDNQLESEGVPMIPVKPFFYGSESTVAFVQGASLHDMALVMGEQMIGGLREITGLALSPDGSRFAFAFGGNTAGSVVIDGMQDPNFSPSPFASAIPKAPPRTFVFSPDSAHVAHVGTLVQDVRQFGVVVDGTLIPTKSTRIGRPHFTPDSRHLFWVEPEKPFVKVYLDGVAVAQFDQAGINWEALPGSCEMGPDGTLSILGTVGGQVTRFRITPSAGTSVETMIGRAAGGP